MGYYIRQGASEFRIRAENLEAARRALLAFLAKGEIGWQRGRAAPDMTAKEAFACARWDLGLDGAGNAVGIEFLGEKLGDDEAVLRAVAPWVDAGSYVEILGEDGHRWRWAFDGTGCREVAAKITWEE
ncbi:MAG TPA: hypothetical protein VNI01_10605 [Elusimicrobiota bacterium]|jgi:hypothetical protein|nr:hypothetical protein [Elusimicrobiota bacterium]